jgi:hypothetical protein
LCTVITMAGHRYPTRDDNDRVTISATENRVVGWSVAVIVVTSCDAGGPPPWTTFTGSARGVWALLLLILLVTFGQLRAVVCGELGGFALVVAWYWLGLTGVGCILRGNRGLALMVAGMRRTKGLRYAAIRKAQQAKQERDAKRLRRERQVEAALAEYFEHVAVIGAIETATAAKVAELRAAAATEVGQEQVAAAVALWAMLELGETRTAVAELTGLTLTGVRDLLTAADPSAGDGATPAGGASASTDETSTDDESALAPGGTAWVPEADTEWDTAPVADPYGLDDGSAGYSPEPEREPELMAGYVPSAYPTAVYPARQDEAPEASVPSASVWSGSPDWARAPDRSGDAWST